MKQVFSTIFTFIMIFTLTACGGNSTPVADASKSSATSSSGVKEEKPLMGATVYDFANDYLFHVRTGMKDAAEGLADLDIVDGQNDQSKMNDQVDTLIQKGVKALLVGLVDSASAQTVADKAKNADIPIVFVNKKPDLEVINSYDKCWYVGAATAQPGECQAEMVIEDWEKNEDTWDKNGDGKMQYIIIKGENGMVNAEERCKGINEVFAQESFPHDLLEIQAAGWNAANAKNLMETWLGKYGDKIECIMSNNDAMALGAIEALKAAGYFTGDKFMPVYGINAIPEGLDELEKGTLVGTVMSDMISEGKVTFQLAWNYLNGKNLMDGVDYEMDENKSVAIYGMPIRPDNIDVARAMYK